MGKNKKIIFRLLDWILDQSENGGLKWKYDDGNGTHWCETQFGVLEIYRTFGNGDTHSCVLALNLGTKKQQFFNNSYYAEQRLIFPQHHGVDDLYSRLYYEVQPQAREFIDKHILELEVILGNAEKEINNGNQKG